MEEALMKSGDFPNVAIKPGTTEHAATGEAVEIPDGARLGDSQSLETEETEQVCPDCDCCGWTERVEALEERVKALCGEMDALKESKHVDRDALQLALVRFATDWMAAAGHIQEQRTIIYHVEKIAELIEGAKQ